MKRRFQILGAFLVSLFLTMGIYLLYHDLYSLISQQRSILEKTAYTISRLIPSAGIELASVTKDSRTPNDSQLQDRLFGLQTDLSLVGSVSIITPKPPQTILATTKVGARKGDLFKNPFTDAEVDTLRSTPLYRSEGAFRLSVLAPIRNAQGETLGLLALESDESATILRLFGYGLHYILMALGLVTIAGFVFLWISNRTSRSLKRLKDRYFTLFRESSDGILILDQKGDIQKANQTALDCFQREEGEIIGKDLFADSNTPFNFIGLDGTKDIRKQTLSLGNHFRSKAKLILWNEKIRYLHYSSYPLREDEKVLGALIIFQDITSDFVREQELHFDRQALHTQNQVLQQQAITDPLTRTLNKQYLFHVLDDKNLRWMAVEGASMLIIDLDNFKQVNDTEGHPRGDQVLQNFAQFLRGFFRKSDKVIRFGGDEFIVLLPRTPIQSASRIAKNMMDKLEKTFESGSSIRLTASVGLAELQPGETGQQWLSRSDRALYEAKRAGKNNIQLSAVQEFEVLDYAQNS